MDQINPFTNAPTNAPAPGAAQPVKPAPQQPPKPKQEFDVKGIVKKIVMLIIGIVIAKLAFDSVMPMFKPQPQQETKSVKSQPKVAGKQSVAPSKAKPGKKGAKGSKEQPPSLSETFAAAKQQQAAAKPAQQQQSSEPFVINGIFLSEGDGMSSAIINNKVVQIGDTVDGAKVIAITVEGVELSRDSQVIKLHNR